MVFTSAPLYSDPSNWNQQPPHAQDQAGSNFSGASGSENYAIQVPPDFALASSTGANPIAADPTSLTANPIRLNKSPYPEPGLKCPRCDSTNTKFCYFNNYSLSQPRHFCRTCRRYWTRGGTLRNVPVGGGSRRNCKRSKVSSSNAKSTRSNSKALPSIRQVSTSSLGPDLGATTVSLGAHEMPIQLKLPQFPFIGALETALPTQMGVSNHLGLNSRYDELLCGSNNTGGVNAGTGSNNNNGLQPAAGLPSVNYSSPGNIFL
ncbi:hypothetical protein LUZ63_012154 [Rhynchospora breviuscula]|uniref:Dof zinc finger protein n=1 Tax=Rhynchospora breviuscula TaxID=2022672 RepID=A0A9Q0HR49_9POAL|nr:hypothetical protein LUZ63_012154 [Rhynchospora breviuscula]